MKVFASARPVAVALSLSTAIAAVVLAGGGASAASAAPPASAPYYVHPNDVLNVQVFGDPSLSESATVLPSGDIQYPLVGRVHVADKTPEQAASAIAAALKKYVRHPMVSVIITNQGQINVLVLGGVQHPGKYQLSPNARLTDAISSAGGLIGTATGAALPDARITDYSGSLKIESLQKLYHDGDTSSDVGMTEGSIVYVPTPVTIDVEVTGAVDHPGEVELSQGDRLSMAIAKAGNSNAADSDLNHIIVTRTNATGATQKLSIDLYQELQGGDVNKDLVMQKGDVVFVPKAKHGLVSQGANPLYYILLGLRNLFPHI